MEKRGKIAWLLVSIVMELVYCKIACIFTWDSFKKCRVKFQVGTPACKFMFFINHSFPMLPFSTPWKRFYENSPRENSHPENSHPSNSPLENSHLENSHPENSQLEYPHPFHYLSFFTLSSLNTSSINGKGGWGEYILPSSLDQKFWYV